MGVDRQKVIMCPRWGKDPASGHSRAQKPPFGRHLANGFFPHSSPRVYYAKANDMQPIVILSPLLGPRERRGYVAFPPTCGSPRRQG